MGSAMKRCSSTSLDVRIAGPRGTRAGARCSGVAARSWRRRSRRSRWRLRGWRRSSRASRTACTRRAPRCWLASASAARLQPVEARRRSAARPRRSASGSSAPRPPAESSPACCGRSRRFPCTRSATSPSVPHVHKPSGRRRLAGGTTCPATGAAASASAVAKPHAAQIKAAVRAAPAVKKTFVARPPTRTRQPPLDRPRRSAQPSRWRRLQRPRRALLLGLGNRHALPGTSGADDLWKPTGGEDASTSEEGRHGLGACHAAERGRRDDQRAVAHAGVWMRTACINPDDSPAASDGWSGFATGCRPSARPSRPPVARAIR